MYNNNWLQLKYAPVMEQVDMIPLKGIASIGVWAQIPSGVLSRSSSVG